MYFWALRAVGAQEAAEPEQHRHETDRGGDEDGHEEVAPKELDIAGDSDASLSAPEAGVGGAVLLAGGASISESFAKNPVTDVSGLFAEGARATLPD